MPSYPQTGSSILGRGPNNNNQNFTGVGLSTQVIIMVNDQPVGAIQTLSVREERPLTFVQEVGNDGFLDSAPTGSTVVSGSCNRVRFDRLRASEAFGRDFLHAHSQRIPFDIDIFDYWGGDITNPIKTVIKNVWIKSLSYDYKVDNWLIFDQMEWQAETISSTINGGLSAAQGGTRNLALQINAIEQAADVGKSRGTLDSPNLINAFFGEPGFFT